MATSVVNNFLHGMRYFYRLLWRRLTKKLLTKNIPNSDHVLRYCKPSSVVAGKITASAFVLPSGHKSLSVNWIEYFRKVTPNSQIERVQADMGKKITIRRNGRFAKINVGVAKRNIAGVMIDHLPESRNLSHAGIYPPDGENRGIELELSHMITADDIFPAQIDI